MCFVIPARLIGPLDKVQTLELSRVSHYERVVVFHHDAGTQGGEDPHHTLVVDYPLL